jgi:hypothetical protein
MSESNTVEKTFSVPAILDGFRPLKDGGASLTFHTQEITKADKVMIMEFFDTFGYLLFAKNDIDISDIPDSIAVDNAGKSPSQRLRAVLYIYWRQKQTGTDFDIWYKQYMEKIIDQIKIKLNEEAI